MNPDNAYSDSVLKALALLRQPGDETTSPYFGEIHALAPMRRIQLARSFGLALQVEAMRQDLNQIAKPLYEEILRPFENDDARTNMAKRAYKALLTQFPNQGFRQLVLQPEYPGPRDTMLVGLPPEAYAVVDTLQRWKPGTTMQFLSYTDGVLRQYAKSAFVFMEVPNDSQTARSPKPTVMRLIPTPEWTQDMQALQPWVGGALREQVDATIKALSITPNGAPKNLRPKTTEEPMDVDVSLV